MPEAFDSVQVYEAAAAAPRLHAIATCIPLLERTDRLRASRIRDPAARSAFVVARIALQSVLRAAFPELVSIRLINGTYGKPRLVGADVGVSVSHGSGYSLVALSAHNEIGVDLEERRTLTDLSALAAEALSEKERHLLLADEGDPSDAFLLLWTLKEAFAKAVGTGVGSRAWCQTMEPRALVQCVTHDRRQYITGRIEAPTGHLAALALAGPTDD